MLRRVVHIITTALSKPEIITHVSFLVKDISLCLKYNDEINYICTSLTE